MKLSKKNIELLRDVVTKYSPSHRMWATGYKLPYITEALAEVLKNKQVLIHVPYRNFVCKGPANVVDSDVKGLMPFSNTRKSENECSTLFYGESPIKSSNYIPFLSCADVYYISRMNINEDYVEVYLVKGHCAEMFM